MEEKIYDTQKFMRGQVWSTRKMNNTLNRIGFKSSINTYGHPVIILSSNLGNATSSLVTCASFTSTNNDKSVNIKVNCPDGITRSVICSQIFNVDKTDLAYYMYSVTDEVVEAILDRFNASCDYSPKVHCSVSLSDIKNVVENIATVKYNQLMAEQDSNRIVADVARSLEQTYIKLKEQYDDMTIKQSAQLSDSAPIVSTITDVNDKGVIDYSKHNTSDVRVKRGAIAFTPKANDSSIETNIDTEIKPVRKINGSWTDELRQQFFDDKSKMNEDDWAYKYGFANAKQAKKAVYNMRWSANKNK